MELIIQQRIFYSNKGLIPAKDIAESIIALDYLIQQVPAVINALFPDEKISGIAFYIEELETGSLIEDIFVKFVFGSQARLDETIASVRELIGLEKTMSNPLIFSAILIAIALTGAGYYLGSSPDDTSKKATIEANNNTIINIGAGMMSMEAEEFRAIIEGAIGDKNKLAKNAVKFVKPATLDPNASITFGDTPALQIQNDTINAMPRYIAEQEEEETLEDFNSAELEVRATDLDSAKRGWGAVIPAISPKRAKLQLDPSIDNEKLIKARHVTANVTVLFVKDRDGSKRPKQIFLREIVEDVKPK